MKRIAITGSSGFIGRALSRTLQSEGVEIVSVDICSETADEASLSAETVATLDGVIHLGAMSRALWGEAFPERCMDLNFTSVASVLRLVEVANPKCWVLLASSKEVYGDSKSTYVREDFELRPKGVYARSKMEAEGLLQEAAVRGMHCGIARLSTVYGGFLDHEGRLIPSCVSAALTGRTLEVDSESVVLDPTHVDDVVGGLAKFAAYLDDSSQAGCITINLCAGYGVTIAEIVKAVSDYAQRDVVTRAGSPRPFMSKSFIGSNDKARVELGWVPETPFHDGLRTYVKTLSEVPNLAGAFRRSDFIRSLVNVERL